MSTTVIQDFVAQFNFVVNQTSVNNTVNNINNVNNAAQNAANTATRAEFSFGKLAAGMAAVGVAVVGLEKSTLKYATSLRDTYYEAQRLGFSSHTAVNHFKAIQQGAQDAGLAIGTIEDSIHATIKAMDMYGAGAMGSARKWAPGLTGKEEPAEQTLAILEGMRAQHKAHPEQDTLLYNDWFAQQLGHDTVHDYINSNQSAAEFIKKRRNEVGAGPDSAVPTAIKLTQDLTTALNAFDGKLAEGMIPTMKLADTALAAFTQTIKDLPPAAAVSMYYLNDLKGVLASIVGIMALFGGGAALTGAAAAIGSTIGTTLLAALGLVYPSSLGKPGETETNEELAPEINKANSNADRKKRAIDILKQNGLSQEAAEGYVANFLGESTNVHTGQVLDPNIVNKFGFAGISQWSPDRQKDFKNFSGYDMQDGSVPADKKFNDELRFAAYELTNGKYSSTYHQMLGSNKTAQDWGESLSRRVVVPFDPIKHPQEFNDAATYRGKVATGLHEMSVHQTNNITINANGANAEEVKNKLQKETNERLTQAVKERSSKGIMR